MSTVRCDIPGQSEARAPRVVRLPRDVHGVRRHHDPGDGGALQAHRGPGLRAEGAPGHGPPVEDQAQVGTTCLTAGSRRCVFLYY